VNAVLGARSALLQVLSVPGYGLQLIERIRVATRGLAELGMGSVYPALKRMEAEGLVRSRTVRSTAAGRPMKYYELTVKGVAARRSEAEALLRLLGVERPPLPAPPPELAAQRLERCQAATAAAWELRRRVLARQRA
jgi:PadR family transcriptional regulator, regulatory protein PadR